MTHSAVESSLADAQRRLVEAGIEIAELLAIDLQGYPDRELERRFLTRTDAAGALSDAAVRRLRERARALGGTLASAVRERLGSRGPWLALAARDELPAGAKELQQLEVIWAEVGSVGGRVGLVDQAVEALAAEHGLQDDDRSPPGYQPPKRFVDRRYLPTLVETVVRAAVQARALATEQQQTAAAQQQRSAAERWSKAGS